MKIDPRTNMMYFVTVEDPGNKVYASWLQLVAGPRFNELGVTNTEKVADIVEVAQKAGFLVVWGALDAKGADAEKRK
jgi:hypothetical protein